MSLELNPVGVTCNLSCPYSLAKGTLVLMEEGYWKPIEEIQIGETVISFDEFKTTHNNHRDFKISIVENIWSHERDALEIITNKGSVICSPDHKWLDKFGRWRMAERYKIGQKIKWISIHSLPPEETNDYKLGYFVGISEGDCTYTNCKYFNKKRGMWQGSQRNYRLALADLNLLDVVEKYAYDLFKIKFSRGPFNYHRKNERYKLMEKLTVSAIETVNLIGNILWEDDYKNKSSDYKKGYLAGIFDAEGSNSGSLRIHNNDEYIISKILTYVSEFGFDAISEKNENSGKQSVRIRGGLPERIRFFSVFKPKKLRDLNIKSQTLYGSATVLNILPRPKQLMFDITTTHRTFFANGLASHNCYEAGMRDAGNFGPKNYDMAKMKDALEKYKTPFSLFGGEALLMPLDDLETIFKWSYEMYGHGGVQTNGALITEKHIEIFRKYRVHVGMSLDGPDELNNSRWSGSLEKTQETTAKSMKAIDMMCEGGMSNQLSLIMTLHRGNATPDKLPRLKKWILELDKKGISSARIHLLELDNGIENSMGLSLENTVDALMELSLLEQKMTNMKFDLFQDMINMLKGEDEYATCIWTGCDPYTTSAVQGIDGQGNKTNCGRTNKDGVNFTKAPTVGFERQLALYHAPQESGGCSGCRFFLSCRGECPGMSENGDWRNKTSNCEVLKQVFAFLEKFMLRIGVQPISLHPRLLELEQHMLKSWEKGQRKNLSQAMRELNMKLQPFYTRPFMDENGHGDGTSHGDSNHPMGNTYTPTHLA